MYEKSTAIVIKAPATAVWDALTLPELIKKYFFGTCLTTDWRVGSPMTFQGEYQGKVYEDHGTVIRVNTPTSLSYSYWSSFSGTEDTTESRLIIHYQIEAVDGAVRLSVITSNCKTQEQADHSAKNWELVLGQLKQLVEET